MTLGVSNPVFPGTWTKKTFEISKTSKVLGIDLWGL